MFPHVLSEYVFFPTFFFKTIFLPKTSFENVAPASEKKIKRLFQDTCLARVTTPGATVRHSTSVTSSIKVKVTLRSRSLKTVKPSRQAHSCGMYRSTAFTRACV